MKHQQQLNSMSKKTKIKHIKKLAWGVLAGVMFGSIALTGTAFAGSLNANEEELMAIARGTFTYDGVTYRAKESYINEAYYYLIRDDVDVTAEQKASAIAQVYASVKQGIDEGYLYPVSGGETSEPSQSTEPSQETENVGGETQGIETEVTKAETVNSNEEKETTIQETTDIPSGEETEGNLKDILEKEIEGTNKAEEVETTALAPEIIALEELSDGEKNAELLELQKTANDETLLFLPQQKGISDWKLFVQLFKYGMIGMAILLLISVGVAWKNHLFSHHGSNKNQKKKRK